MKVFDYLMDEYDNILNLPIRRENITMCPMWLKEGKEEEYEKKEGIYEETDTLS